MPSPVLRQPIARPRSAIAGPLPRGPRGLARPHCSLSPEDLMVQSCPEASPAKWHLAHTTWFFETFVLRDFLAGYQDFHPDFHWLFNSYYNSLGDMPAKNAARQLLAPAAHRHPRLSRARRCGASPGCSDAQPEYPANAEAVRRIALGLEHEQQHQELIATDIKHALFTNPLHPAYREPRTAAGLPTASPRRWSGWRSRRPDRDRLSRRIRTRPDCLLLRQRDPAPHRLHRAVLARHAPRHLRRVSRLHGRQRLHPPGTLALRGLDDHSRARLARAALLAARSSRPAPAGASTLCTAGSRWTTSPKLPSATSASSRRTPTRTGPRDDTPGARLPTEFEWEYAAGQVGTLLRGAPQRRRTAHISHCAPTPSSAAAGREPA